MNINKSPKSTRKLVRSYPCPRGCAATWHEHAYFYGETGDICLRTYWKYGEGTFSPYDNKALHTVRGFVNGFDMIVVHPTNPKWIEHYGPMPVKRCC